MTDDRSLERAARQWLEDGPTRAPDRAVDAALLQIQTTHQDRAIPILWRLPNMNTATRLFAASATVAVLALAGLFALRPGAAPSVGSSPSASPTLTPTASPTPSVEPSPRATPTPPIAACGLITTDEAGKYGIMGNGSTSAGSATGSESSCIYTSGDIAVTVTLIKPGGKAAFDSVKVGKGIQVITGVGTNAVFDPASATMYVAKGDAMAAIVQGAASQAIDARLRAETELAKLVAGRL